MRWSLLKSKVRWGDAGQVIGLVVVGTGVGLELALKADWCLVLITVGSVVFAVGTKLKGR
jgi:hypothetical protein